MNSFVKYPIYFFFGLIMMIIRLPSRTGIMFHFSIVFQIVRETQQQHLTLLLEQDRPAFEKDVCLHFCPFVRGIRWHV